MSTETNEKVKAYIEKFPKWKDAFMEIRDAMIKTEMLETVKWGMPTYQINGKNVVGFAGFKNHFGVWFHNGSFLKDTHKVLENAQEGKTRGMRHIKYTATDQVNRKVLEEYLLEAIQNQKDGKEIKVKRVKKDVSKVAVSEFIKTYLSDDALAQLDKLTISRRNEYIEYIDSAKRESTKFSRLEKVQPLIEAGKPLAELWKC